MERARLVYVLPYGTQHEYKTVSAVTICLLNFNKLFHMLKFVTCIIHNSTFNN